MLFLAILGLFTNHHSAWGGSSSQPRKSPTIFSEFKSNTRLSRMLPFVGPVVSRSSVSRCIASGNKGWACGLVYTRSSYTGPEGGEASLVAGDLGTFAFGLPCTENICLMHTKSDCLFLRIYHQLGMVMSSSPSVRLRQSNASVRIPQMEYPEDTAKRVWDVILHFEVFTYRNGA